MNAWPAIGDNICIDADGIEPKIDEDGLIVTYGTRDRGAIDGVDYGDESYDETKVAVARTTYRRNGFRLEEVSSWVDDVEQVRRQEQKEAQEKWEREWEEHKKSDLLYLRVQKYVEERELKNAYVSIGRCYKDWHPTEKFDDGRICRRVHDDGKLTIDLEWGRRTAPVKVEVYRNGEHDTDHWFPHSVEGIEEALVLIDTLKKGFSLVGMLKNLMK